MTSITTQDMCTMLKKNKANKTSSTLDAGATSSYSGTDADHAHATRATHASTHKPKTVSERDGSKSVSSSAQTKDGSYYRAQHALASLESQVEQRDQPMGNFTLEATHAARSSSTTSRRRQQPHHGVNPISNVSRTKMQRHIDTLRRNNIVSTPIEAGVPITPPTFLHRVLACRNQASPEDQDVIREFDQDVAGALVCLGGSLMGLPQEDLVTSPGMRKLVARNIRWFQNSHDVLKLVGLMAAKKLNQWVAKRSAMNANPQLMLDDDNTTNTGVITADRSVVHHSPPPPYFSFRIPKREREETEDTAEEAKQTEAGHPEESSSSSSMVMVDVKEEEKEQEGGKGEVNKASFSSDSPPAAKRIKVSLRIPKPLRMAVVRRKKDEEEKKKTNNGGNDDPTTNSTEEIDDIGGDAITTTNPTML